MAENNDNNLKKLFDHLEGGSKGWDFNDFKSAMTENPDYRKKIYDNYGGAAAFGDYQKFDAYVAPQPIISAEKKRKNRFLLQIYRLPLRLRRLLKHLLMKPYLQVP